MAGEVLAGRISSSADRIGLIFPVHALTVPLLVRRFLRQFTAPEDAYLFAVATRSGTVFRGFQKIDKILKSTQRKRGLEAGFTINMLDNEARQSPYKAPGEEEILEAQGRSLAELERVIPMIRGRKSYFPGDSGVTVHFPYSERKNRFIEKLVLTGMDVAEKIGGVNYFYVDDTCIGCGICERVCLSGKIDTQKGKPVWNRRILCYMCYACLHFCPSSAVQIDSIPGVKSFTETNDRYPHPYAKVQDIENQKKQTERDF